MEECNVSKYGTKRKALPIPKSVENEILVGDRYHAVVDRKQGIIAYIAVDNNIIPPEELNIKIEKE